MKKIICLLLVLISIFQLSSCGKKRESIKRIDEVIELIDSLPQEITLEDEAQIIIVQNKYNELSTDEQEKVTNYDKLVAANNEILKIKDVIQAQKVDMLIETLPSVENIKLSDKSLLMVIRLAYLDLTESQKQYVSLIEHLINCENKVKELESLANTAQKVVELINNLPAVTDLTISDITLIETAREGYEMLNADEKPYVTNLTKLTQLESYLVLLKKAKQVVDLINELPSIANLSIDDENLIYNARRKYDSLNKEEKQYVNNLPTLVLLEEEMKVVKDRLGYNLEYLFNDDEHSYTLIGLGNTRSLDIEVLAEYNGYPVTKIGPSAFHFSSDIRSIVIPSNIVEISSCAFSSCYNLESVKISDTVISINSDAFSGCSYLATIIIDPNNPVYDSRNSCNAIIETATNTLIAGCLNTVIPDTVTSLGDTAFFVCYKKSIIIPKSVKTFGTHAFSGCDKLISVYYQGTLADWCEITFKYSESNPLKYASEFYALDENNQYILVDTLSFPEGVTSVNDYQFYQFRGVTTIEIPSSLVSIGTFALSGMYNVRNITVDSDNPIYDSRDNANVIIETATNTVIIGSNNPNLSQTVTSIGDKAFYNCGNMMNIELPSSLLSIGNEAFYNCAGLNSINIPENVNHIGDKAFFGCIFVEEITVNPNNKVFDSRNNCNAIIETATNTLILGCKNTVIPEGIEKIGENAFYECVGLKSINIPASVTSIAANAFYACINLEGTLVLSNVSYIDDYAFSNCHKLESILISDNIINIGFCSFNFSYKLSLYLEVSSIPNTWDKYWNYSNCPVYLYSETTPLTSGNYWHYIDGVITVW